MSNDTRHPERGFTLLELIVVIALLGLVSSLATDFMVNETNQQRYETTQQRMEKIRYAIIGDVSRTLNGQPDISGFFTDTGRVPTHLIQLAQKEYCSDGKSGTESDCITPARGGTWKTPGYHWKGPYLSNTDLIDGWGKTFAYSNSDEIVITSLGLDRITGTTSTNPNDATYETDQKLSIPVSHYAELPFKITQQRMEKIRYAIIGDVSRTLNEQPVFSGFIADMGEIPTFLTQLTQKEYCSDGEDSNESSCTAGSGVWRTQNANWKGPYLSNTDLQDGWGNRFTYTNRAGEEVSMGDDMVITSLGLDKALGATSTELENIIYETDQQLVILASHYAGQSLEINIDTNTSGIPDEQFCLYTSKPGLPSEIDLNIATIRPISFIPDTFGGVTVTVFKKTGAATTSCDSIEATGFTYTANYIYVHNLIDVATPPISIKLLPTP